MKSVKGHLALVLPLFAILFALEYMLLLNRVINNYEMTLKDQYALIVVAKKGVTAADLLNSDKLIAKVVPIDANNVLKKMGKDMGKENLEKLKAIMPAFFSIKLNSYPDENSLQSLKENLKMVNGVKSVHAFEKTHDKLYDMLLSMKSNFYVFSILIALVGFLLIVKQMSVWQLEHKERMQIMAYFGAPLWLRSGVLIRMALMDALMALILLVAVIFYLIVTPSTQDFMLSLGIDPMTLLHADDAFILTSVGFGTALFCSIWVALRFREI